MSSDYVESQWWIAAEFSVGLLTLAFMSASVPRGKCSMIVFQYKDNE